MARPAPLWLVGHRPWKYGVLLAMILSLFILEPFLISGHHELMDVFFGLTLLIAALAPAHNSKTLAVALALGLPAVALVAHPQSPHWLRVLDSSIHVLLLVFALTFLLVDVLRTERVTLDKVFGGMAGYLLVAMLYAVGYTLLEGFEPGSFSLGETDHPFARLTYFSVITLCSVGYGDLLPLTDKARSLSALEAVTGQFYLTVLVGRLVALQILHQEKD